MCHAIEHHVSSPLHDSSSGTSHPISHLISYNRFSPTYRALLATITSNGEPKDFSQAIQHPQWRDAMAKEIATLEANNTCEFISLPTGKKSAWV